MPIYEYECRKCKAHLEIMQKISDKPLTRCPKCKGRLEKQWSPTSFQFKGSGWYVTDYAAKKSDAKAEGKEEKKATASESEKSPAKETSTTKPKTDAPSKKSSNSNKATSGD